MNICIWICSCAHVQIGELNSTFQHDCIECASSLLEMYMCQRLLSQSHTSRCHLALFFSATSICLMNGYAIIKNHMLSDHRPASFDKLSQPSLGIWPAPEMKRKRALIISQHLENNLVSSTGPFLASSRQRFTKMQHVREICSWIKVAAASWR